MNRYIVTALQEHSIVVEAENETEAVKNSRVLFEGINIDLDDAEVSVSEASLNDRAEDF